ncbi:hypothetical protein IEQ34_014831 [Dendrobium chrysotoxum]|uniref:Uncharacterized protein n=1 Tax=Dendrobium chrysotoxum TaxID=161865 RepID=A0AAV7GMQ6_DENCH|nr:hypothetical protein IEQ34_014831 [Dendrobium chrysotoxum]
MYSTSFSASGSTSLAASAEQKRSAHSANRGVFVLSRKFIPVIISTAFSQLMQEPRVMSTKSMVSSPKKLFPLLHLTKASSNSSSAKYSTYLVVDIGRPEANDCAIIGIGREDARARRSPDLVYVLHNDKRLADGFIPMDEYWNLLVDWIGLEKKLAFVRQIIWKQIMRNWLVGLNRAPFTEKDEIENTTLLSLALYVFLLLRYSVLVYRKTLANVLFTEKDEIENTTLLSLVLYVFLLLRYSVLVYRKTLAKLTIGSKICKFKECCKM